MIKQARVRVLQLRRDLALQHGNKSCENRGIVLNLVKPCSANKEAHF